MFAIIFGLVMSVLFFMMTSMNNNATVSEPPPPEENVDVAEDIEPTSDSIPIEIGHRAITLPVDEIQSVSRFVKPGSYVDMISVINGNPSTAQLLLQDVKVLAVGTTTENTQVEAAATETQDPYTMVTVELDPEDAVLLTLARQNGFITLIQRATDDHERTPNVNLSLEQLIKGQIPQ